LVDFKFFMKDLTFRKKRPEEKVYLKIQFLPVDFFQ